MIEPVLEDWWEANPREPESRRVEFPWWIAGDELRVPMSVIQAGLVLPFFFFPDSVPSYMFHALDGILVDRRTRRQKLLDFLRLPLRSQIRCSWSWGFDLGARAREVLAGAVREFLALPPSQR